MRDVQWARGLFICLFSMKIKIVKLIKYKERTLLKISVQIIKILGCRHTSANDFSTLGRCPKYPLSQCPSSNVQKPLGPLVGSPMAVSFEFQKHLGKREKVHQGQVGTVRWLGKSCDVTRGQVIVDHEAVFFPHIRGEIRTDFSHLQILSNDGVQSHFNNSYIV